MKLSLATHQIDVWLINLDDPKWDTCRGVLSKDEALLAMRFLASNVRDQRARCKASIRMILSEYLTSRPAEIEILADPCGKPCAAGASIHFNISHSGSFALIAVSGVPVGVDMEHLSATCSASEELINFICSGLEADALKSLTPTARKRAFYRLWTKKESYCKAIGTGIARNLAMLHLSTGPGCLTERITDTAQMTPPYYIHELALLDDYMGCVCTPSPGAVVQLLDTRATGPRNLRNCRNYPLSMATRS